MLKTSAIALQRVSYTFYREKWLAGRKTLRYFLGNPHTSKFLDFCLIFLVSERLCVSLKVTSRVLAEKIHQKLWETPRNEVYTPEQGAEWLKLRSGKIAKVVHNSRYTRAILAVSRTHTIFGGQCRKMTRFWGTIQQNFPAITVKPKIEIFGWNEFPTFSCNEHWICFNPEKCYKNHSLRSQNWIMPQIVSEEHDLNQFWSREMLGNRLRNLQTNTKSLFGG